MKHGWGIAPTILRRILSGNLPGYFLMMVSAALTPRSETVSIR